MGAGLSQGPKWPVGEPIDANVDTFPVQNADALEWVQPIIWNTFSGVEELYYAGIKDFNYQAAVRALSPKYTFPNLLVYTCENFEQVLFSTAFSTRGFYDSPADPAVLEGRYVNNYNNVQQVCWKAAHTELGKCPINHPEFGPTSCFEMAREMSGNWEDEPPKVCEVLASALEPKLDEYLKKASDEAAATQLYEDYYELFRGAACTEALTKDCSVCKNGFTAPKGSAFEVAERLSKLRIRFEKMQFYTNNKIGECGVAHELIENPEAWKDYAFDAKPTTEEVCFLARNNKSSYCSVPVPKVCENTSGPAISLYLLTNKEVPSDSIGSCDYLINVLDAAKDLTYEFIAEKYFPLTNLLSRTPLPLNATEKADYLSLTKELVEKVILMNSCGLERRSTLFENPSEYKNKNFFNFCSACESYSASTFGDILALNIEMDEIISPQTAPFRGMTEEEIAELRSERE